MKTQTATIIIIHGTYGYPKENWFPWLAESVEKLGYRALIPTFPTPENQTLDSWHSAFTAQVGSLHKNMVLVGHSLGPAFIFRLLEETNEPIIATFLVSSFVGTVGNSEFDAINATFFTKPFDWRSIKKKAGMIRLYHGDNDPYVPLEKSLEIAHALDEAVTVVPNGGHLNAAAGFVKFERLLFDITQILEFKFHKRAVTKSNGK